MTSTPFDPFPIHKLILWDGQKLECVSWVRWIGNRLEDPMVVALTLYINSAEVTYQTHQFLLMVLIFLMLMWCCVHLPSCLNKELK